MGKAIKTHVPCLSESCRSSDAATVFEDDEGKQYWKCFSCNSGGQLNDEVAVKPTSKQKGTIQSIPERDITKDVAAYYGVTQDAENTYFPYSGGFKVRKKDAKTFHQEGKASGLFGQDKFPSGGKFVTVTEGEYDALAAFTMLGKRYPVVSIRNGAAGALRDCSAAYEWLDNFDKIVIDFDADEPGQKAAAQVAELFSHKALVIKKTKHKDANEYLSNQASKDYVDSWWRAEQYVPDGIVCGTDLWERINKPVQSAMFQYPWEAVNKLTFGVREGELVTLTAGSGLGKSQVVREVVKKALDDTSIRIGLMCLEESVEKTGLGLMSLAANKPLHLPTTKVTPDEYRAAYDATLGTGRVYLFDHFGSSAIDNIVARVRYFAKGLGCTLVVLDHVSIVVSAQQEGDERKAIDEIMTKLRTVVQETKIALVLVSHLKRPEGKGHEEGAHVSMGQLRGSAAIGQLSDIALGLERNGQAEDPIERNTTYFRVLKNRFSGLTGPCGAALYDPVTGRMTEKQEDVL